DQEVGDLEIGGVFAQLLDRDPAVLEDARLTVDVGDRRAAGGRVGEGGVIAHQPEVVLGHLDLAQVHRLDGPVVDLDLVAFSGAVVGDAQGVAAARSTVARGVGPRLLLGLLLGRHQASCIAGSFSASISRRPCGQTGLSWRSDRERLRMEQAKLDASPRKRHAREMFAGLPRRYDAAGAVLSFGQDPRWRRAMVARVEAEPGQRVLDVATGTGMVAAALVRRYGCRVVGLDQ